MKRLAQVMAAAVIVIAVAGCGVSTAVRGEPVPAPGRKTAARPPTSSAPVSRPPSTSAVPSSTRPTTTSPAVPDGPEAVVRAYFDAINAHDYQRAWELGGKNVGQPYEKFAAGFATTDHDVVTIRSTQGNTVTADLTAVQTDGTTKTFHGTYTVTDGTITRFSVRPS